MQKIKIFTSLLIISPLLFTNIASADNATTSLPTLTSLPSPTPIPQVLTAQQVPPIITAINLAKAQLEGVTLNHELTPVYKKSTKSSKEHLGGSRSAGKILGYNLSSKDIALAIFDPSTNTTTVTIGRQNGKKMIFPDHAVDVSLTKFNGVNSKFQVNKPAGGIIVSLKYLISGVETGSKPAIEKGLSEAVYVPLSSALNSPEVVTYGAKYLSDLMDRVTKELNGLPSQAIPGKNLTDAIPAAMIKSLIYAEHTDSGAIMNGRAQEAIDQLNILFATNGNDAYKYSVSTAGARGIAQFIPDTYVSLVKRHPEAFLIADFTEGMSDHKNAIKAMYLLLDDYAGTVRAKAQNGFASGRVFDYGAASYNAGTGRVIKAVNLYGNSWNEDRSGQTNAIQAQINNLTSKVKTLKARIKATKDTKTKIELQTELASVQNSLNSEKENLNNVKVGTLKNETVNYLKKIYAVIQFFNDEYEV